MTPYCLLPALYCPWSDFCCPWSALCWPWSAYCLWQSPAWLRHVTSSSVTAHQQFLTYCPSLAPRLLPTTSSSVTAHHQLLSYCPLLAPQLLLTTSSLLPITSPRLISIAFHITLSNHILPLASCFHVPLPVPLPTSFPNPCHPPLSPSPTTTPRLLPRGAHAADLI